MRRHFLLLFVALLVASPAFPRVMEKNEVWSGKVNLEGELVVGAGVNLSLLPGTEILMGQNAVIMVEGSITAKALGDKPVVFHGPPGAPPNHWQGINLSGAHDLSLFENVRLENAAVAFNVATSQLQILSSEVKDCGKGVQLGADSRFKVEKTTFSNLKGGGVEVTTGTKGLIHDSVFINTGEYGVKLDRQTVVEVTGCKFSGAKLGILVSGGAAPIEDNVIDSCEVGIGITSVNGEFIVRNNRISKSAKGIACHQFASPTLLSNIIETCDIGIECFQASSPIIKNNRIAGNKRAISCIQLCNPEITLNELTGSETAIYLHLSSYAVIQENVFDANKLVIELDNMSFDWEQRAGNKPKRQRQAQNEAMVKAGKAVPGKFADEILSEGFVDARNNYWGKAATQEMDKAGPAANIKEIKDGYDVPTLTYEGWPGSYKVDKVKYDGWKKERIPGAGLEKRPSKSE